MNPICYLSMIYTIGFFYLKNVSSFFIRFVNKHFKNINVYDDTLCIKKLIKCWLIFL